MVHFGHKETDGTCGQSTSGPSPTHQMPVLDRKVKAGKVGYRDCTCRKQEKEERNALVWEYPGHFKLELGSSAVSNFSLEPLPTNPLSSPIQSILFLVSEVVASHPGYPSVCLCSTLAEKGPILFPCWPKSVGVNAVCYLLEKGTVSISLTLVQRLPLELNKK